MLVDIVSVQVAGKHKLHLEFEDGTKGTVDLSNIIEFSGIFEVLEDPQQFSKVKVNEELGVVCWSNGADLDSDVLYSIVSGAPLPKYDAVKTPSG